MKKVLLGEDVVQDIFNKSETCIDRSKCPTAKKGDRLFVKEPLWISECGKYYARSTCQRNRGTFYDVLSIDGRYIWYGGDRTPQWDYPDYRFMVCGYSSRNNTRCKKRHAFGLSFGEFNTGMKIDPGMGNTRIGEATNAVFMKCVPSSRMPKWAVRLWLDVVRVRGDFIEIEIANNRGADSSK